MGCFFGGEGGVHVRAVIISVSYTVNSSRFQLSCAY